MFLVYVALLLDHVAPPLDYVALPLDYLSHFLVYLAAPQHVGYFILPLDRKTHIFPWEWVVLNKQAGPTLFISTAIMVR